MSAAARTLVRRARGLPVVSAVVAWLDRRWWARVILRAGVVDGDIVAAQLGRRVSDAAAVRRYVGGGFREGLVLNPLFCEPTVSRQLSDADRVPALYAYLVNDRAALQVSPNWDAPALVHDHPESLEDPAGPLGHAWRAARRTGTVVLGRGASRRQVPWAEVTAAAYTGAAGTADFAAEDAVTERTALVCTIATDERDPDLVLHTAANTRDTALTLILEEPGADLRVQARILALWAPVRRIVTAPSADADTDVTGLVGDAHVVVTRGPHAQLDADAIAALSDAASRRHRAAPLWIAPDGTVAAAGVVRHGGENHFLLAGHPPEDALALGTTITVPEAAGATRAWPVDLGPHGTALTLLDRTVIAPTAEPDPAHPAGADTELDALLAPTGFAPGADPGLVLRRGRDARRWAIKTAAPAGPAGEAWGDTHFARGLAAALRRQGAEVVIDSVTAAHRPTTVFDDVCLVLRGPERIDPPAGTFSILWIISHPDEITADELSRFDVVFAASEPWARWATQRFARPVRPLLQCTDSHRFHPSGAARTDDIVFVGTARGIARPAVVEPLRAGIPVRVYGPDWRGFIPGSAIAATGIPNRDLPLRYETARVVLNDHWPAMQRAGFIANRPYDVVAAGGRVISDDVEGLEEHFRGAVRVYRSVAELTEMLRGDVDALFPDDEELARISADIRRDDSFDARAQTLLAAAEPADGI